MLDPDEDKYWDEGAEGEKTFSALKVAEDLVEGSNKRVMLDISRKLDTFSKMQVRKQRLVEPDPTGEEIRQRPIRHLGELSRVAKQEWATRQQAICTRLTAPGHQPRFCWNCRPAI